MNFIDLKRNLSHSEMMVARKIASKIPDGGRVVVSSIVDGLDCSRSTATNTLKKLELAGVVETRNLGIKGTYIEVLEPKLWAALSRG